jgi:hypothetical protein
MYAQYARVSNKGAQTADVFNNGLRVGSGATTSYGFAAPGGSSTGYEFGVRHAF